MNTIGLFGFFSIAVALTFVSGVSAGRWGDSCSANAECNRGLACRNGHCLHPCEERFDQNAICNFVRGNWFSQCNHGYSFDSLSQKCERKHLPASLMKGDTCEDDFECRADMICRDNKCVHPCEGFSTENAYCTLRNDVWISECLPGYTLNEYEQCVPMYASGADPSRHSCTYSQECAAPLLCTEDRRCTHPCEMMKFEHGICFLDNGIFTTDCRSGYHFGGNPKKCEPQCTNDVECPNNKACVRGRCINPCSAFHPFAYCTVEHHQPKYTCRTGYVRPSGFRQCVSAASLE